MADEREQLERHLSLLVEEYGRRLLRDPQQLAASISDVAPGRRAERRALEAAAEAGVADALLEAAGDGRLTNDSRASVAQPLVVAAGLAPELAAWVVGAFARALQLAPGAADAARQIAPGGCVVTDAEPTTPVRVQTPTPPDWAGAGGAAGAGAGPAGEHTPPDVPEPTPPVTTSKGGRRLLAIIMSVAACATMSFAVVGMLGALFTDTSIGALEFLLLSVAAGLGFGLLDVAFEIGRFHKWWR